MVSSSLFGTASIEEEGVGAQVTLILLGGVGACSRAAGALGVGGGRWAWSHPLFARSCGRLFSVLGVCEECDVAVEADIEGQWCMVRVVPDEDARAADCAGEPRVGEPSIREPSCELSGEVPRLSLW